jgi:hypothetical protein
MPGLDPDIHSQAKRALAHGLPGQAASSPAMTVKEVLGQLD